LPEVWSTAENEAAAREELENVLADWIALGLALGHPIPPIDGIAIGVERVA
jgi:hypothetical protein